MPVGSLKSNLGHLITAAGLAGLIKVLGAIKAGIRPPTLHVDDPNPVLEGSPFRLLQEAEPWPDEVPLLSITGGADLLTPRPFGKLPLSGPRIETRHHRGLGHTELLEADAVLADLAAAVGRLVTPR